MQTTSAPTIDIGLECVGSELTQVSLTGSATDADGDTLSYAWTQLSGQNVTITDANMASASFTAPDVSSSTMLRFQLTVTDPLGLSDSATVTITVNNGNGGGLGGDGGGGGAFDLLVMLLLVAVLLERMLLDDRLFPIRSRRNNVDRDTR